LRNLASLSQLFLGSGSLLNSYLAVSATILPIAHLTITSPYSSRVPISQTKARI
jgi:hypothetical protein